MTALGWTSVCSALNLRMTNLYPILSFLKLCQIIPAQGLEINPF